MSDHNKNDRLSPQDLKALLEQIKNNEIPVDEGVRRLQDLPYELLGDFARLDHHRAARSGFPEVIFCPGKTPEQIVSIFQRLTTRSTRVLATRLDASIYESIRAQLPEAAYNPAARAMYIDRQPAEHPYSGLIVASGGTADIPAAEEASLTASLMGCQVERLFDVGVAGLHRLIDHLPAIRKARVIIAAAGMEGALPSVIAGLVDVPVIALPTSVGYGASFGGVAALLAMLNSCANGVAVVNIDNGFGAGYLAATILRSANNSSEKE